jgi:hypothetical protein
VAMRCQLSCGWLCEKPPVREQPIADAQLHSLLRQVRASELLKPVIDGCPELDANYFADRRGADNLTHRSDVPR